MTHSRCVVCSLVIAWLAWGLSPVQAAPAIHWINESGQGVASVLNSGSSFITTFRTSNDVTITQFSGSTSGPFIDNFGGSTPGNNPLYLTTFVGSTSHGTGDGTAGHVAGLNMTGSSTGSMQFDFAQPINALNRLLFVDVDFSEQYRIEAFALQGASYVPLSLLGWTYQTFSGQTGIIPDSRWPSWNSANGLLTASASGLNEELSVLVPDQPLSRLIISKLTGAGASTVFQVIELPPLPADVNHDGIVNGQDIALVAANWLATGIGAAGDANNDGIVNGQDIALIAASWLATSGGSSAEAAAVPEPPTSGLLALGSAVTLWHRGRRSRRK